MQRITGISGKSDEFHFIRILFLYTFINLSLSGPISASPRKPNPPTMANSKSPSLVIVTAKIIMWTTMDRLFSTVLWL